MSKEIKKKKRNTKEVLNNAAISLFVEHGINATTTKMITKLAGVAEGTLYRHYESKEQMAFDLFYNNYISLAKDLIKISESFKNSIDKVKGMTEEIFNRFNSDDKNLMYFLLLTQHTQIIKISKETITPVKVFYSIIEDGINKKEICDYNPELLTSMVLGLITQPIQFSYYGKTLDTEKEVNGIIKTIQKILEI